jgi:AcrR family transcriptional regulator
MLAATLTRERILAAAEKALRRHGPAKANVVDVARALGVSHGSVYRHFPSKAALRDAVTERWLGEISSPLAAVADEEAPAAERLPRWLDLLVSAKRRKALDDPELFATYIELTADAREAVTAHVDLTAQLARNHHGRRRRRRVLGLRPARRRRRRLRRDGALPQPRPRRRTFRRGDRSRLRQRPHARPRRTLGRPTAQPYVASETWGCVDRRRAPDGSVVRHSGRPAGY